MVILKKQVAIIGAGRLGACLALMFRQLGDQIAFVTRRNENGVQRVKEIFGDVECFAFDSTIGQLRLESSMLEQLTALARNGKHSILFLTVSDDSLQQVSEILARAAESWAGVLVFHASGGQGLSVLAPFQSKGAEIGSIHPCYPVSRVSRAEPFVLPRGKKVCYAIAGTPLAREAALALVQAWDGVGIVYQQEDRLLYHAGNMLATGHLMAVLIAAFKMLENSGLSEAQCKQVLLSLLGGVTDTLQGLESGAFAKLLTGPFVRDDQNLISKQRVAIDRVDREVLQIYDLLGSYISRSSLK